MLEGLGWRIHRVWSTAWAKNPESELARIEEALRISRVRVQTEEVATESTSSGSAPEWQLPEKNKEEHREKQSAESSAPDLFDEYVLSDLSEIRVGDSLLNELNTRTQELIRRVVDREGPIHIDLVVNRLRTRYGLKKAGNQIRGRVLWAADELVQSRQVAWASPGDTDHRFLITMNETVSARPRKSGGRKIHEISGHEIQNGLVLIVVQLVGVKKSDLTTEAARQFGYKRTGSEITDRVSSEIELLIKEGKLVESFGMLTQPK